jgi:hypothetical protein
MTLLLALESFAIGAFAMLVTFAVICVIPEIEDFFRKRK